MAAASAGLIFINGVGAIAGPITTGWMMGVIGPFGFFLYMSVLFAALAAYAAWRMTRRPRTPHATSGYTPIMPTGSVVAAETAAMVDAEDARLNEAP